MTIHTDRLSKEALDGIRERARQRIVYGQAYAHDLLEKINDDVLNLLVHADAMEHAENSIAERSIGQLVRLQEERDLLRASYETVLAREAALVQRIAVMERSYEDNRASARLAMQIGGPDGNQG